MYSPGTIIDDKYQIISLISAGGFDVVYKADQSSFDRIVALKVLEPAGELSGDDFARFELEARVLNELRHRNVVLFYGFGFWHGRPYMAMEYLSGETLQEHLEKHGHLSPRETLNIIRQVADALDCVHDNGVVHRDLKPTNIMLCPSPDGTIVKLIDFGLVKKVGASGDVQQLTGAGMTVGTTEYMSPEQCLGKQADNRSDLYALGCVMYRCLARRTPFVSDNPVELMRAHVGELPPPLHSHALCSDYDRRLQMILDKSLAKDPAERYQSARQILHDLDAIDSGKHESLIAEDKPSSGRLPEARVARKKTPRAMLLLAAALGAAAAVSVWQYINPAPELPANAPPSRSSPTFFTDADCEYSIKLHNNHNKLRHQVITCYEDALRHNKTDHLLNPTQEALANVRLAAFANADNEFEKARKYATTAEAICESRGLLNDIYEGAVIEDANALLAEKRTDDAINLLKVKMKRWDAREHRGPYIFMLVELFHGLMERGDYQAALSVAQQLKALTPPNHEVYKAIPEMIDHATRVLSAHPRPPAKEHGRLQP